jgi:hypothetical protein
MTEKSLGRCLGLAHERPCGLRIEGARDIVEPAELEDRELVLEGRQHLVGDALRPIDGIPGDEARTLQQAVISQVDVDQNCVNAVERRTAVEAKRQVQADDAAHRFPMVLQIAYPDRKALDEALASPVRALGREATRGLYEFFAGRFFTPSTKLRNQVQK